MKVDEWKKGLISCCDDVERSYMDLKDQIDASDTIIEKFDPDELGAFMMIKLNKLVKKVEKIMG